MKQGTHTAPVAPAPTASHERSTESINDLLRNLASDLSTLLGKEMALAKAEIRESVSEVKTATGALAMGATIAMAGLVVVLLSAVYGLSNVVDPWLAALIVGAAALLVGFMMVSAAKKKMSASSIVPDRTLASAKKDMNTLERATR